MQGKEVIEEKRVKRTVIRRRSKIVKDEPPKPVEEVQTATELEASPEKDEAIHEASPKEEVSTPKKEVYTGAVVIRPADPKPSGAGLKPEKELPRKPVRKKSRAELEMELIKRAGGLKQVARLAGAPDRLDRVFQPTRRGRKKRILTNKDFKKTELTTKSAAKRVIRIETAISVGELAKKMSLKLGDIVKKLMDLGVMATANQVIDFDTAVLVANDYQYEVENVAFQEDTILKVAASAPEDMVVRPPVVTVMGHVDHGKTSLLDTIRKTQVADGESGGITQHIGAYQVETPKGLISFIDTPGHAAFTSMRARGANITDIVILVVAADDGVMPQTIEAINHARAAKVPIIVAINKVDKPDANIEKVRQGLMEHSVLPEDLGGDDIFVQVSAKDGTGIDELLETILLQAEVAELKANPKDLAEGVVIEARLDKGRGTISTVLVQKGTLKVGDSVVAGLYSGRVRALMNWSGENVKEAGPSVPVEVLGIGGVPNAGDMVNAVASEDDAKEVASNRLKKERQEKMVSAPKASLEDLFSEVQEAGATELKVVIKSDVQGSSEALRDALVKLSTDKVKLTVIHVAAGAINESDVTLAHASKAIIIGFGVRPDTKARALAENEGIEIKTYTIIYEIIDDIKKAMIGLLAPTFKEIYLGRAEVREVFTVSKVGQIAGSMVVDGKITRGATIRLLRDGTIIFTGKVDSLKRFKDDAKEVTMGTECGIGLEKFNDIKAGDLIEAITLEELEPVL